jgi:hypothetical protein
MSLERERGAAGNLHTAAIVSSLLLEGIDTIVRTPIVLVMTCLMSFLLTYVIAAGAVTAVSNF